MQEQDVETADPPDEEIALTAYRIWLQEGCPHGKDREHWLQAREQLMASRAKEQAEAAPDQ